ncbi:MAG: hypothetical protein Q7R56_00405 [Nanoarchaeota archaeon]|nr:hypothetical protein [Nanoarchaeota archaeon]
MQPTNWKNIEIKRCWDNLASILDEQMIYFSKENQERTEKEIEIVHKHISTLK